MEIGGYFGLELTEGNKKYHHTPFRLKSGRAALAFILKLLKPSQVYVPFYTCNALLEPLVENGVEYTFYGLNNELEIKELPKLKDHELIIYVNYFDIKRSYAEKLSQHYGKQLIIDCTQSYFHKGNGKSWYFNSCRKFFGVPDGADLYTPNRYNPLVNYNLLHNNTNYITDHLLARFNGDTQMGYKYFARNEALNGEDVSKMSRLSVFLMSNLNYKKLCEVRQRNFRYLHQQLGHTNLLKITDPFTPAPCFYPYLPAAHYKKETFWDQKIFLPVFWKDCLHRANAETFETETHITKYLLPIPVDHRYKPSDFNQLLNLILP